MNIRELHNKAMELADMADLEKMQGNKNESVSLYKQSYSFEYEAAMDAYENKIGEPSVSVFLRSAASLAMICKKFREAEKLIALALSGEPPLEIADELRNLLENVNFRRHLEVKGTELSDDEIQLVISGNGVGYGYARTDEILSRIDTFKNLTIRTVERISGRKFRKNGPVAPELKIFSNPYLSSPRAASMAFRIKFGNPQEPTIPGLSSYEPVIDDIVENISLINDNKVDVLKERITDTAYFDNFLALTKELAPDGDAVNLFGITSIKQGKQKETMLCSNKKQISETIKTICENAESVSNSKTIERGSNVAVIGILKAANATTNMVEIFPDDQKSVKLKVPDGLSDIVKKYWDEKVSVDYYKKNKKDNLLVNIEKID
jgi:hypothetical protein